MTVEDFIWLSARTRFFRHYDSLPLFSVQFRRSASLAGSTSFFTLLFVVKSVRIVFSGEAWWGQYSIRWGFRYSISDHSRFSAKNIEM
jgi:hypothetical protein